jgi:signal transduction histidine kinase
VTPVVLNVDDHGPGRYARSQVLRAAGLLVREAATAADALRLIERGDIELVILDINLPDLSGLEVCRRLRSAPSTAGIAVLQVSATFTRPADAVVALEGGADAFLVEPVEPEVLVATVKALLRARRAEEALQRAADEWQATFDTIADGVAIVDAGRRLVRWNAAFARLFGVPGSDLAGVSADTLWDGGGDGPGGPPGEAGDRAVELERNDRWFRVCIHPMKDGGSVCVVADVTERRRADDERQQLLAQEQAARADAEAANRSKDHFLGVVSHELRMPLTPILGWARILRAGNVDPETRARALDAIERSARLQARLIEDLLDVSRIIAGKIALDFRPVTLNDVVDAAVEAARPAAAARRVRIEVAAEGPIGPVMGDPARLQQVVGNLVSNGVKFTPPGGRVDVSLARTSADATICVRDTGQGIAPEALPQVFDRFWQAEPGTSRRQEGLGLGLTITRHLVELHGGTVTADSRGVGEGARFTVTLPLATLPAGAPPGARAREDAAAPDLLSGVRVLLVDDAPDARDVLREALETFGAEVTAVDSGLAALSVVGSVRPHVLLSDIALREVDGYELVRRLRQRDARDGGAIPAIAITGYARSEDRARALAAGFQAHVAKPVDPDALAVTIASLLEPA